MQKTIELAKYALKNNELPIAAIIYLDDKIIAQSYTSEKKDSRYLIHAELKALIEADKLGYNIRDRKRMQLFTTLEPCMMCIGASMTFFIGEIYYGLDSESDGAVELAKKWNPESDNFPFYRVPKIQGGILKEEITKLFCNYLNEVDGPMKNWVNSLIIK